MCLPIRSHWLRCRCLFGLAVGLLAFIPARGSGPVSREYEIKAAYLYNFTKFIQWPLERFENGSSPLVIVVLGRNPFGDVLAETLRDRTVNGRPVVVRFAASAEAARGAHVVFVPATDARLAADWLAHPPAEPVLVVGEVTPTGRSPGMIVFVPAADKVRFEIDQPAMESAGVKVSAQLLKLATRARREAAP